MMIHDANSTDIFLLLLRSGLYGTPIPEGRMPERIDWKAVVALAKKHFVLGTIIEAVPMLPEELRPSDTTVARMSKFAIGLIQTNIIMDKTAAHLVATLRRHGIEGVLLKGQGIARIYPKPQMRQSGDIDFYVGKRVYKKACDICRQYLVEDKSTCAETFQHFDFTLSGVTIELHRIASRIYSPVRNRRFQRWIISHLENSTSTRSLNIDGTEIHLPSLDFDAIFIFYHAWRHFIMGGIGMRQLCDWAMIFHAHADEIDTPRLIDNIHSFGMTTGWKLFACIAVHYLGIPRDKMPLYDPTFTAKSEKVLQDIIDGGNFGHFSKANTRVNTHGSTLAYGLGKARNVTEYFFSLFPLLPVEATFLYASRLYEGAIACFKRSKSTPK